MVCGFYALSRIYIYPPHGCKDISMFYARSFIIFAFLLRSVIHLQLICVCVCVL